MMRKGRKLRTGSYEIEIGKKWVKERERQLFIRYIGPWATNTRAEVSWDERTDIELWGDFEVVAILAEHGYDRYVSRPSERHATR
jgi:hypothetical protein